MGSYMPIGLNIIKDTVEAVGMEDNVGTHTLKKIWGYHSWENSHNSALIMETLNLGSSTDDKSIHIVCALKGDIIWMITAYYPSKGEWLDDLRARRR